MIRSVAMLLFSAFVSAGVAAQPAATSPEGRIQAASDALSAARTRGDAAAFAALFTDDGTFMVPGLPDAAGRTAVRDLAKQRFEGGRTEDIRIHRREIQVVGDAAYELAWYSETDRRQEQSFRLQGRQFILWKRGSDDVWRVQRYLYNFSGAEPLP